MNKKIDLFHFGDCGLYDKYNPLKLFNEEWVSELLYLIASWNKFEYNSFDLADTLEIDHDIIKEKLNKMCELKMIESKEGFYRVCFTIFLNRDIQYIKKISTELAHIVGDIILEKKDKILKLVEKLNINSSFDAKRILYHIIGDRVLDGAALDFFDDKGLFTISKSQPDKRNYILTGYEISDQIEELSKKLLCSSNNIESSKYCFNSFGDCNGNRKDIYRFFRQNQLAIDNATDNNKLNILYNKINDKFNLKLLKKLGKKFEEILENKFVFDVYSDFMKEIGYLDYSKEKTIKIKIPVFRGKDREIQHKIEKLILETINEKVCTFFTSNNNILKSFTPLRHNIANEEISVELWHLVFGEINQYLIDKKLFADPKYIDGQGRFFQSIYID